jgi:hypothetical protein
VILFRKDEWITPITVFIRDKRSEHVPIQGIRSGALSCHDDPLIDEEEGGNRLIDPASGTLK